MERPLVGFLLAFMAGTMDAWTFGNVQTFAMVQSGNVAVTFVVQMVFNFLVQAPLNRTGVNGEPNLKWAGVFFFILLGFAAGGAIGFLVDAVTDGVALFLPAAMAFVLGLLGLADLGRRVDPTPGGLIG